MQSVYTILLLIVSNIFMTCAWYGHLKMKQQFSWFEHLPLFGVILFSWFLASLCSGSIFMVNSTRRICMSNTGESHRFPG